VLETMKLSRRSRRRVSPARPRPARPSRARPLRPWCFKCQKRRDPAEFAPGDRFGRACRATTMLCRKCGEDLSVVEFTRDSTRIEMCARCHAALRVRRYAAMKAYYADKARAEGSDPMDSWHYRHYSRDPADVWRDSDRRRKAAERAAHQDPYERHDIFERDRWRCSMCGTKLREDAATIDHIVPDLARRRRRPGQRARGLSIMQQPARQPSGPVAQLRSAFHSPNSSAMYTLALARPRTGTGSRPSRRTRSRRRADTPHASASPASEISPPASSTVSRTDIDPFRELMAGNRDSRSTARHRAEG
jgi:hypothetical protein